MFVVSPRASGIYLIANAVTGKVYVGSARDLRARTRHHLGALRRGTHANQLLQRAWARYGESAFRVSVLEFCGRESLWAREQHFIDSYRAADRECGYNLNPIAAGGRHIPHSEETKRKIGAANAIALKGRKGRPMPDHVRAKISGRFFSGPPPKAVYEKAWAASRGNTIRRGVPHTAEARALMSAKTRGEKNPKAVLSERDLPVIRALKFCGHSGPAIARMYGVYNSSIYSALSGKTWRHAAEAA